MGYKAPVDLERYHDVLINILRDVVQEKMLSREDLGKIQWAPLKGVGIYFGCDELILAYRAFAGSSGLPPYDNTVVERLRLKPVRTSSGVATVTILTKPFPCPGECIFCPNDVRMPKSYLS